MLHIQFYNGIFLLCIICIDYSEIIRNIKYFLKMYLISYMICLILLVCYKLDVKYNIVYYL